MTLLDLYDRAEAQGIEVDDVPMRALPSGSFPEGWILLDTAKLPTQAEEAVALAHELGHIETGSFYDIHSSFDLRSKHEYRADKRAVHILIPKNEFMRALKRGICEVWELAEYFGVTESFIRKAILLYAST